MTPAEIRQRMLAVSAELERLAIGVADLSEAAELIDIRHGLANGAATLRSWVLRVVDAREAHHG